MSPSSVAIIDSVTREGVAIAPGDIEAINMYELQHLRKVRGHIEGEGPFHDQRCVGCTGCGLMHKSPLATNPGGVVDGARMLDYYAESRTLVIRVDSLAVPGFWLEILLSLRQVDAFAAAHPTSLDKLKVLRRVKGRIEGRNEEGKSIVNPFGMVDGARLVDYNPGSRILDIRVESTAVPNFWLEIPLPLDQVDQYVAFMTAE